MRYLLPVDGNPARPVAGKTGALGLVYKNWLKDPLTAHNVDNIKNEKIFV